MRLSATARANRGLFVRLQAAAAAAETDAQGEDVLLELSDKKPLQRSDAFAVLSSLVVPPDALLQLLLADSAAARQRSSTGTTLQQEALAAAAEVFGAAGASCFVALDSMLHLT